MSTYVVLKRMREDRHYMPNEVLVDPDLDVDILMQRGFLQVVPDNYTPPKGKSSEPVGERPPSYEEALAAGYSESVALKLSQGEYDDEVEADVARLEAENNTSAPDEPFTEDEIKALVKGLLDVDLDRCISYYEVEVEDESNRESKEEAMVAFLVDHPEIANSDEPLVPESSDLANPPNPEDSPSVGAPPPADGDDKQGSKKS